MNIKTKWITAATIASTILIFPFSGVHAQEDRDRHDDRYDDRDRGDHDRRMGGHRRFDDRDRDVLRDWYQDHADQLEFRGNGDRGNNEEIDRRLQVDQVFDRGMRRWARPVPDGLASRLGPLPREWRYMMIGYNVCMVDGDWNIRDVFHFDQFNDHDREAIRDWNRDHPDALKQVLGGFGVRMDNEDLDRRLQVGATVDPGLRDRARPAPDDLADRLSAPPRGWHYVTIGDRLCLVDRDWRIHESFHFEH